MSDDVVSLLQRAKETIAAGWGQGDYEPEPGLVCASKAIQVGAAYPIQDQYDMGVALAKTMNCDSPGRRHNIPHHNDYCLRTQADALDWFDRAIAYAKEQP